MSTSSNAPRRMNSCLPERRPSLPSCHSPQRYSTSMNSSAGTAISTTRPDKRARAPRGTTAPPPRRASSQAGRCGRRRERHQSTGSACGMARAPVMESISPMMATVGTVPGSLQSRLQPCDRDAVPGGDAKLRKPLAYEPGCPELTESRLGRGQHVVDHGGQPVPAPVHRKLGDGLQPVQVSHGRLARGHALHGPAFAYSS